MRSRAATFGWAGLVLAGGCVCGVDLSSKVFRCQTSSDCLSGYACIDCVCTPSTGAEVGTGSCAAPDAQTDAGKADAGATEKDDAGASADGGSLDSGVLDGGAIDAGRADSGSMDAGSSDGGSSDAGPVDSGIPANLIHWWKLDDGTGTSAADSAGDAPGTLAGGASWVSGVDETFAVSVGDSSYSGGGTVSFPTNLPSTFTLSFWAKATAFGSVEDGTGAYNNTIVGGEVYLTNGFRTGFTPSGVFNFWTSQSGGDLGLADTVASPTGTWIQFVVTYSNGAGQLYRNGSLVSSNDGTYVPGTSAMGIATGVGGVHPFWGDVDDVRIYDQVLSPSEIAGLY
jgi:hypothetical protein